MNYSEYVADQEKQMTPKSFHSISCQFYTDVKCSTGKLKHVVNQCTKNAYKFPWESCFDKSLVKDKKEKKYRGYKSAHLWKPKAERITKNTAAVWKKKKKNL